MDELKKTKIYAWSATIVYALAFPFLVIMAFMSLFFSDDPNVSSGLALLNSLLFFSVPVSIPISLFLIWTGYKKNYKRARRLCFVPLILLILAVLAYLLFFVEI